LEGGIRSLNVALRKELDLYACVRPVRWFRGTPAAILDPKRVDFVLFRENTEDVYAGIEFENGSDESKQIIELMEKFGEAKKIRFPESSSFGLKPISKEGSIRLFDAALKYALENNRRSVTIVHKGNIMKFTEGYFKKWTYAHAEEHYSDRVFTWAQYDRIQEENGTEAANAAQKKAIRRRKDHYQGCDSRCIFAANPSKARRVRCNCYNESEWRLFIRFCSSCSRRNWDCPRSKYQLQIRTCYL